MCIVHLCVKTRDRNQVIFLIRSLLYILETGSLTVIIKVTIAVEKHVD